MVLCRGVLRKETFLGKIPFKISVRLMIQIENLIALKYSQTFQNTCSLNFQFFNTLKPLNNFQLRFI
jgi:hypothetical protein